MFKPYFTDLHFSVRLTDVAERVFQRCVTANITNPDHPDYKITFNYEFLDDVYSNWKTSSGDAMSSSGTCTNYRLNLLGVLYCRKINGFGFPLQSGLKDIVHTIAVSHTFSILYKERDCGVL